jgi:hypothetical protein
MEAKRKILISLMSDSHSKHRGVEVHLPGGDILLHSGDLSSMGYKHEIESFCGWFSRVPNYTYRIFIAGNHDWGFQKDPEMVREILERYPNIIYLEDSAAILEFVGNPPLKVWGSPWQPEFCNWAFNLPRNGEVLKDKWAMIPEDTDILLTHGPAWGFVDRVVGDYEHLGCELLTERILEVKPKIHLCGHIHSGYGHIENEGTHHINASILDERYAFTQKPINLELDMGTGEVEFLF